MSHVNISSSNNFLSSGDISDFSGYIMEDTSSNLANEFVFDADFFVNLFDVNKKVENKKLLSEFGLFWNENGKLVIHDIKFSGPSKIDYLGNIRQDSFFTKIYRTLGNKGDKIHSKDLAQLVVLEYCQKNNIEYIYEPLVLDKKFFVGLFDINNSEENKGILDELGRKRNEKGEFLVNGVYFDDKYKISSLNRTTHPAFYKSISALNGKKVHIDRREFVYDALVGYCKNNNIKYIYEKPRVYDKEFFGNLFDIKNRELNKDLLKEIGCSRNEKGEILVNNMIFSQKKNIVALDGLGSKTFYNYIYRLLVSTQGIETNAGDVDSNASFQKTMKRYFDENGIKCIYKEAVAYDKKYFSDIVNIANRKKNEKIFQELGRLREKDGGINIDGLRFDKEGRLEFFGGTTFHPFYLKIYRLLGYSGPTITGKGHAQKIMKEYCDRLGIKCVFTNNEFDKEYFTKLFDIGNRLDNEKLFNELGRKWNIEKGCIDINDMKFRHEIKIHSIACTMFSVFYSYIYKLLGDNDGIRLTVNGYPTGYESAAKLLLRYFDKNNIKYIYKEPYKFDKDFFEEFFDINNKEKYKIAFGQLGRKRLNDGSIDISNVVYRTSGKVADLNDVGYVSFYTNIYRQLDDKSDIELGKNWYVEKSKNALLTVKRYAEQFDIQVKLPEEWVLMNDKYFIGLFDYNKQEENKIIINELGRKWTEKGEFDVNSIKFLDNRKIASLGFTMRTFYSNIYRLLGYSGKTTNSELVTKTAIEYCEKYKISYIYKPEVKLNKDYFLKFFDYSIRDDYENIFLSLGFGWSEHGKLVIDNVKYLKEGNINGLPIKQMTFYTKIYDSLLLSKDDIKTNDSGGITSMESCKKSIFRFCKENDIQIENSDNIAEESIQDILNGKTIKEYISLARIVGWKPIIEILMTQYRSFAGLGIENVEKILGKFLGDSKARQLEPTFEELSTQTLEIVMDSSEINDSIYKSIQNEFIRYIVNYKKSNDYPKCDYRKLYKLWRAEFVTKTKELQSHLGQTMNNIDKYRNDVINHSSIDSLKSNLGDEDRSFPGFEQWINIMSIIEQKRLLVADDMGLGKTGTAIGSIEYLKSKGKIKNALIVSPANMIHTWLERLNDGKEGYFVDGRAPRVLVLDGKSKFDENFENYDYILMSSARLSDENVGKVVLQKYDMMVVDEIHEMKNTTSGIWSQNLIKLSDKLTDNSYLLALSGTPIPNKIKDISIMMRLLYPDEFDSVSDRDLVKNIVNQDKLSIGIKYRNKTNRKKLTDWIKMPNKVEENIYIRQTELESEMSRMIIEDNNLTHSQKLIFLRKLYMCPQSLNPDFGPGAKMIAVADKIISELKTKSNIYIVLNDYIDEMIRMDSDGDSDEISEGYIIDYVKSRIAEAGFDNVDFVSYHGNTSNNDRIQIQEDFNNKNDKKKLLFVSGNAAKVGIDFSGADSIMTYNQPRTLSDMYQQEARVYRVGLDHDIHIYRFIVDDTLESGIYTYTHSKHRAVEKMVENKELMTDAEINLIMSDDIEDTKHHADSDFAYYYSNEKSLLYDMFAINKGVGEERFVANMSRVISGNRTGFDKYADIYNMLGKRSYQGNANRINNQIISLISKKNNIDNPKILDLACGNQLLARVSDENLQENILSMDINDKYIDNAFAKTMLDDNGNARKFKQAIGGITKGSMINTHLDGESQDFVNLSLAYHYTGLSTSGSKFDRIQSLIEINRVLKTGGICIINEIYSLDFADREYLTRALGVLGFEIVEQFSGNATSVNIKNYSSNILTIRKIGKSERLYDILSDADVKKSVFRGLRFRYNKDSLHSQSFMIDKFDINGRIYNISLNQSDKNLQNEESKTVLLIDSLKDFYGDIMKIPENILYSNGFFSYYDKNKKGKKLRKIARKLSDGSFVFV